MKVRYLTAAFLTGALLAAVPAFSVSADETAETFKVGETWTVDGEWSLKINGISETEERNQFNENNPEAVYIVDYSYRNLGYTDPGEVSNGLYFGFGYDDVTDCEGEPGYAYPVSVPQYPKFAPYGTVCFGQCAIGVDHAGPFEITVRQFDHDFNACYAVFEVDPDASYDEELPPGDETFAPDQTLKLGETWSVEGLWNLTIDSVEEIEERNEYMDYNPNTAYKITYTYENTGYESDISDGLYMTVSDNVIDAEGQTGLTYYPNSPLRYAEEVKVGESCTADGAVGLEHPGTFYLIVSKSDNDYNQYVQVFELDPDAAPSENSAPETDSEDAEPEDAVPEDAEEDRDTEDEASGGGILNSEGVSVLDQVGVSTRRTEDGYDVSVPFEVLGISSASEILQEAMHYGLLVTVEEDAAVYHFTPEQYEIVKNS